MMDQPPLIDVAIPTCDRPELLRRAVESVRANTLTRWRMTISDDSGIKLGADFVRQFNDPRIQYLSHAATGMVHDNWDSACRAGKAPYVFKLDDDDTIEPDFLELTVAFLEKNADVSVVYTGYTILTGDKAIPLVDKHFFADRETVDGLEYVRAILLNEGYPWNHKSAGVFRRKKAESIQWFKYARMDVTFSMALAIGSRVGYLPARLFNYYRRSPGETGPGEGMKPAVYESILRDFNEFFSWPFVAENPEIRSMEHLAKSRIQFTVPLMYLSHSIRRDPVKIFFKKWKITQRFVPPGRSWLLLAMILPLRLLPASWLNQLHDWYACTGWVKKALNFFMPH